MFSFCGKAPDTTISMETKRFVALRRESVLAYQQNIITTDFGFKYHLIEGVPMPPSVSPARYFFSRSVPTRPGDICICSYPKSGSTWFTYIVYLITHECNVPEDVTLHSEIHWVESSIPQVPCTQEELESAPTPRVFKSCMPYQMTLAGDPAENPNCKYLYICRNPKDVCTSYYFFDQDKSWTGNYCGPWNHYLQMFLKGKLHRGSWFDHVKNWWAHRDLSNVYIVQYEELLSNFDTEISKLAKFLNINLSSALIDKAKYLSGFQEMKNASFSAMHEIPECADFFREGKVGSWKKQFTVANSEAFDEVYTKEMEGCDLKFKFG